MEQRQQQRPGGASASAPSQTITQERSQEGHQPAPGVLRLRGARNSNGRSVQWADDVVDNEGLGRKSSKVCCIYHKPKAVDESSDDSSDSSSSSDEDSDADNTADADRKGKEHACGHNHGSGRSRGKKRQGGKKQKRPPSPNAYEKVPKPKPKDKSGETKS